MSTKTPKSPSRPREGLGVGQSATRPQAHPRPLPQAGGEARTDWTREEIADLFDLPFTELVFRAAEVHRAYHRAGEEMKDAAE